MQKCPKCGYRERFDWPTILRGLVFCGLCLALVLEGSKKYISMAIGALFLFNLVQLWESSRIRNLDSKPLSLFGDGNLGPKPPANS